MSKQGSTGNERGPLETTFWDEWADLYDAVDADRTEMVRFYQSLVRASDHSILELGCGTGRVTSALADRMASLRGNVPPGSIVGVEISQGMLDRARARDVRCSWILGDMRRPAISGPFDLVVCCYNSLQDLLTDEDVSQVFAAVSTLLAEDGTFAFDVYHPNEAYLSTPQQDRLVRKVVASSGKELELREDTTYNRSSRIYTVDWRLVDPDRPEPVRSFRQLHRQYPAAEMERLLRANGLAIKMRADDFSTVPRRGPAKKQVVVAGLAR
jgi:trans-aconitate methyltransferase